VTDSGGGNAPRARLGVVYATRSREVVPRFKDERILRREPMREMLDPNSMVPYVERPIWQRMEISVRSRLLFAPLLSLILAIPLVVAAQTSASATCAPRVTVVDFMFGSIRARSEHAGCTFRPGDRLCLQKEIGYNNWQSVTTCRGGAEMQGTRSFETDSAGCTSHPNHYGKYRAYAVIAGKSYSYLRWCSA
jgi:hypothetical protein